MIRTGITHGSPEWFAARREFIGGSEVSDVMGYGYIDERKHRTEAEQKAARVEARNLVLMRKAGLAEEWEGNETSKVGQDFEPGFVNMAKRKWGWTLIPYGELVYDRVCSRLACTPDFYVDAPWGRGLVQTKMTTAQAQEDCKPKKDGTPSAATYADGPPLRYTLQKQAELACTGLEWNCLLVLHCAGGEFKLRPYVIQRHPGAIARIRAEVNRAWDDVEKLRRGMAT